MPDHEAVDSPRGQIAGLGPPASIGHVIENPGDLGRREVGVDHQARSLGNPRLIASETITGLRRATVLPDQGRRDGSPRIAFPNNRRLPLIGQSDGRDPIRFQSGFEQRPGHLRTDRTDQRDRIVLDPAGLGVARRQLGLALARRLELIVVDNRSGACRSLVDHQKMVSRHRLVSLFEQAKVRIMRYEESLYHSKVVRARGWDGGR